MPHWLDTIACKFAFPVPEPSYDADRPLRLYDIEGWFVKIKQEDSWQPSFADSSAELLWVEHVCKRTLAEADPAPPGASHCIPQDQCLSSDCIRPCQRRRCLEEQKAAAVAPRNLWRARTRFRVPGAFMPLLAPQRVCVYQGYACAPGKPSEDACLESLQ